MKTKLTMMVMMIAVVTAVAGCRKDRDDYYKPAHPIGPEQPTHLPGQG